MSAQCADIFYHLFTICFTKQFPHFQQPSIMRLDINLERMVIHRNILLQVSRGNILDAEIIGLWNNECCYNQLALFLSY